MSRISRRDVQRRSAASRAWEEDSGGRPSASWVLRSGKEGANQPRVGRLCVAAAQPAGWAQPTSICSRLRRQGLGPA